MSCCKLPVWLRGAIATAVFTVVAIAPHAPLAVAQSTPSAELDAPAPEECLVAPRSALLFPDGVGQRAAATPAPLETAPATPFVAPTGEAADAETVAAVTATVRESIACRNANDFLRAYALFTQDMIVALFGGPATVDPEIQAAIAQEIGPLPRRQRIALISLEDVVVLPDGRVGAFVATGNARRTFRDYLFFEQDPPTGRWLIDETRVMGDG